MSRVYESRTRVNEELQRRVTILSPILADRRNTEYATAYITDLLRMRDGAGTGVDSLSMPVTDLGHLRADHYSGWTRNEFERYLENLGNNRVLKGLITELEADLETD